MPGKALPFAGPEPYDPAKGVTILPVVVDGDDAWIDPGALHGQSRVEQGITFASDPSAARRGRTVWTLWIGLRAALDGKDFYFSAVGVPVQIDAPHSLGHKPSDYYTHMIDAIQGDTRVDGLSDPQRDAVATALETHDPVAWERRGRALTAIWP